jgi:radical SAM protein with 4Fe4S-binding SPASM domain
MNKLNTYTDTENRFAEIFNPQNGFYLRTGILDEHGKDTGIDPFMRNFPSLLDIGVMGHCKNSKNCTIGCYQGKLAKPNMSLDTFKGIIDQCKDKTFEVALGGFGSPNEHEDFVEIVKYAHDNGVIPNYTTSGIELTNEQLEATKKYCGAVAVSYYRMSYTYDAIDRFIGYGCKTNIHYVLSDRSIDEAIWRLGNNDFPAGINAVIFLLFKPVGCGKSSDTLHWSDPRVERFYSAIENNHLSFKVGLDACNMPGVINFSKKINPVSTSPCDGGSFSAYITSDNYMLPCSFDNVTRNYAFDLNGHTIKEGWKSESFNKFRNYHHNSCPSCAFQNDCRGGCCLVSEINLCNKEEREYYEN